MELFENKVGRPTNEIKKKRKLFIISIVVIVTLLIGISSFYIYNKINAKRLAGSISDNNIYSQDDPRWANTQYCGDPKQTYGLNGCGPTSLATAVRYLTGKNVTPLNTGEIAKRSGACAKGNPGTRLKIVPAVAKEYGLDYIELGKNNNGLNEAKAVLGSGGLIVAYVDGSKMTSLSGDKRIAYSYHYVLLFKGKNTSEVYVANSKNNHVAKNNTDHVYPKIQGPYNLSDFVNKNWLLGWYGVSKKTCPKTLTCPSTVHVNKEFTCTVDSPRSIIKVTKTGLSSGYNKSFVTTYTDLSKQTKYTKKGTRNIKVTKNGCNPIIKKVRVK